MIGITAPVIAVSSCIGLSIRQAAESAKTTLLSLLSGPATPTKGSILYNGEDIAKIDQYTFRSRYIGVIFQSFNLITKFTAAENVILSMDIAGTQERYKKKKHCPC